MVEYEGQKVINVDIENEMKKSFMEYSMSVIVARALPDVRDGLKPVHRRILYTMHENSLTPDKAYRKCADTVGSVLGRYHPHGDASVYDALVRMAQDFSLRYPLVDGHGNFGSVDGHPAAAYRYTEARMSKLSTEMLTTIEKDTVDFIPNYDDRLKEPTVLPTSYPNLLVNGSTGIAVGMATNIPPHNLSEVIDGLCMVVDNPECELEDIMEHIQGPDFPTGGSIMGRSGIRAAYATGKGKIILRAKAEIVEKQNGRFQIIISEIPYQVNKANLIVSIADMVRDKKLEGISNIEDHTGRTGLEIVIDVKKDAAPQIVLNQLYKYSQLQITFGIINLAIVNGVPKTLTIKEMLEEYIAFQIQVIIRRTMFDLKKAEERAHILRGLLKALDHIEEVIAILRASKSIPEGKQALMERFDFDEIQATHIVQMRLGQLTGLEKDKLDNELEEISAKIADLNDILSSEERRKTIIKDEALEIKRKYGDERKTDILAVSGEVDIEDLIPVEDCVLTYTHFGYVKRLPVDTYHAQKRGGRGITGLARRDEDFCQEMFIGSTHDYLMFFTSSGRAYRIKCYEIPEGSRTSKGMNIANILPLTNEEKVTAIIKLSEIDNESFLCMVTQRGYIKRVALNVFKNIRKNGVIALDLNEGDMLTDVRLTDGQQELLVATKYGRAIRFKETDVRKMGRLARGVRAIRLVEDDFVVGMARLREDGMVLTVTETGYGRLSAISDYRMTKRGGKGIINYRVAKFGNVAAIKVVDKDNEDIIMISDNGIIIRIAAADIRVCARPSKGVKVMRITEDAILVAVARAPHEEDEVDENVVVDEGDADEGAELESEIEVDEDVEDDADEAEDISEEDADSEGE